MRFRRRSVRDPGWDLEEGDVLALDLPGGGRARVQIVLSQPPDEAYDYRRVTARVIDPDGVDLTDKPGEDGIVPVGAAAAPVEISVFHAASDLASFFDTTLSVDEDGGVLGPAATPGLVVLVPDERGGSPSDPSRAGFRTVQRGAPPVQADGFAVLIEWDVLGERLRSSR